ncbi:hypothetical protein COLO4_04408 [Corchorus olitorius]|uniref:Uncharacterized protein n=1 Tax=Corchorus olitorius TaxID=93759 RepID=A0A1R3KU73_9ROSI|nr:hypothetical protein COLO4_04408 [Corchorus olitorius]
MFFQAFNPQGQMNSVGDDDAELALVSHQGGVGMRMSSVDLCVQLYDCIMQIYIAYLCLK